MAKDSFLKISVLLVVGTFIAVYYIPLPTQRETRLVKVAAETEKPQSRQPVYYPGCNEVRALGKAPLYRDDPGYRENMDGDSDGIACEPHS